MAGRLLKTTTNLYKYCMKKIIVTITTVCLFCNVFAQQYDNGNQIIQYLFVDFNEGSVLQKSGTVTKTKLNYNTLTHEMIFQQNDQNLALDRIWEIDTVFLNNKKCVPGDNMFYEVATNTPIALYIQYESEIIAPGNETGFGKSQTSAITNVTDLKRSGKAYALSLPDEYSFKNKTIYLLKKDGNFITIHNVKDVKKVFAGKEDLVDAFVKTNKISFKKDSDVIKLIEFCNNN